jgi:type II secretory pathway pseudopilin PulG
VEFGVLVFFVIVAILIRGVIKAFSSSVNTTDRRRQLQQIAQRMRAAQQRIRPGFPQPPGATYGQQVGGPGYQQPPTAQPGSTAPFQQPATAQPGSTAPFRPPRSAQPIPTAPVAPPTAPFTARWPAGAPTEPPQPPRADPFVVEVAEFPSPQSAFPTDEPTAGDMSPDVTGGAESAPPRRRYELSSSLDTTLSTSLTSSLIGEPGSVAGGPQTVPLSPQLQQQVLELVDQGYEVMAVRLVCDEMDVGILDAHKTVRTLAGLPTVM